MAEIYVSVFGIKLDFYW